MNNWIPKHLRPKRQRKHLHSNSTMQIMSENSPFAYTESFNQLRTNLKFVTLQGDSRVIAVTSAIPGEGKSSVSVNLAMALAADENKVLLIDCDLRKPMLHRYLSAERSKAHGLSSVLSGFSTPEDCIQQHKKFGFSYLLSGAIPPNPSELLGSKAMGDLLAFAHENYDYVICDTPPVSLVVDAAVISQYCKNVLLVVKQNFASFDQVRTAKNNLQSAGANIIGTVLNQYDIKENTRYSHGGNYNYYSYYGNNYEYKQSSDQE